MEAYPLRIRQRIVELYQQGMKTKQIAELFGTCKSGTRRVKQYQRERGTLEPIKPKGGRKPILGPEDKTRLCELVAQPRFTKSTLHRILHNRIYIVEVWYQGIWYQGKFEPLIDREVAELAVKAFELSQSLTERWVRANYEAKRTILGIMLESVRLNSEKLEFSLRKPFDLLRDEKLVPLIGAMGI